MKTLEQIKNDYAVSKEYKDWQHLRLHNFVYDIQLLERYENEVMKIYAMECLKLASENAMLGWKFIPFEDYSPFLDKESITNEKNIIK